MGTVMNGSDKIVYLLQPYNFEILWELRPFVEEYWSTSIPIALIYLLLIFVGQNYMKTQKAFNLQGPLFLWSFCLAIFSIMGTVRTWSYMGMLLHKRSLMSTMCFSTISNDPVIQFWSSLFVLSKVVEFGDTAFIILRKRPLIFLHWYHHSTVVVFSSFIFKKKMNVSGWFMILNYGVHSIMYTYYTLKAAKVKLPRWFPRLVTTLQILQMFIGVTVITLSYIWRQEQNCHTTMDLFFWACIIYISYLIFFSNFFYQAYILSKVKDKNKRE